jgi:hypothetical protein
MIALDVDSGAGSRRVDLLSYLDGAREERAHEDAYTWIKTIRHLRVDGVPFRSRFTFRGDSLWWFAELYLHKEQAILNVLRTLAAFEALVETERPLAIRHVAGGYADVVAQAAALRKIGFTGPHGAAPASWTLLRMDARATTLALGSRLSRLRSSAVPRSRTRVAAFVHTAFWRSDGVDGSAESYIGPVLRAIEARVPAAEIRYVGIGARTNFRARRWWDPLRSRDGTGIVPIERYAPASALTESRAVYGDRHKARRSMWASADLRAHAVIRGCDCWPLVRKQLAGIALLQFPWSARAMDEAAAALAAIEPEVAVTYAEAGGWGRALALECRRRGVPLAGLQHGFIYRHWLNYRHEADELVPDPLNAADHGFPFPASTLLFDEHAARHLSTAGRFPSDRIAVTGSARLDELVAAVRALTPAEVERARRDAGAIGSRALVLFAAKEREARRFLPALLDAVRALPDVQLAIKPHPAETPGVYARAAAGIPNVHVLPTDAPLPALLAAARVLVTVNSTVAVDALALGLPSLVIGLPNNLSPFVAAGVMAGAGGSEEIRAILGKLLYDQEFRDTVVERPALPGAHDGGAASRSAEAILALASPPATTRTK